MYYSRLRQYKKIIERTFSCKQYTSRNSAQTDHFAIIGGWWRERWWRDRSLVASSLVASLPGGEVTGNHPKHEDILLASN